MANIKKKTVSSDGSERLKKCIELEREPQKYCLFN